MKKINPTTVRSYKHDHCKDVVHGLVFRTVYLFSLYFNLALLIKPFINYVLEFQN